MGVYLVRHVRYELMKVSKWLVHVDDVRPVTSSHWSRCTTSRCWSRPECLIDTIRTQCSKVRPLLTSVGERKSSTSAEPRGTFGAVSLSCLVVRPGTEVEVCVV